MQALSLQKKLEGLQAQLTALQQPAEGPHDTADDRTAAEAQKAAEPGAEPGAESGAAKGHRGAGAEAAVPKNEAEGAQAAEPPVLPSCSAYRLTTELRSQASDWSEHTTKDGSKKYYYNKVDRCHRLQTRVGPSACDSPCCQVTKQTTWKKPRELFTAKEIEEACVLPRQSAATLSHRRTSSLHCT